MALISTLKLFPYEVRKLGLPESVVGIMLGNAPAQPRAFADAGGQALFGTDVGYQYRIESRTLLSSVVILAGN